MTATHAVFDQNKIMRLEADNERLRAVLQEVAQHRPGTPGLHFDSLELLIASATGIAIRALEQSKIGKDGQ